MLKKMFLATFIFLLLSTSAFAQKQEQEIKTDEYELKGCFDTPCYATIGSPSLFEFSLRRQSGKTFRARYTFLGRTGEKTFDVNLYRSEPTRSGSHDEVKHVYFERNDTIAISHGKHFSPAKCSSNDAIHFKILDLQGNKLKYQIIVPECLKKIP